MSVKPDWDSFFEPWSWSPEFYAELASMRAHDLACLAALWVMPEGLR